MSPADAHAVAAPKPQHACPSAPHKVHDCPETLLSRNVMLESSPVKQQLGTRVRLFVSAVLSLAAESHAGGLALTPTLSVAMLTVIEVSLLKLASAWLRSPNTPNSTSFQEKFR